MVRIFEVYLIDQGVPVPGCEMTEGETQSSVAPLKRYADNWVQSVKELLQSYHDCGEEEDADMQKEMIVHEIFLCSSWREHSQRRAARRFANCAG